jgi:hypothetical protein
VIYVVMHVQGKVATAVRESQTSSLLNRLGLGLSHRSIFQVRLAGCLTSFDQALTNTISAGSFPSAVMASAFFLIIMA